MCVCERAEEAFIHPRISRLDAGAGDNEALGRGLWELFDEAACISFLRGSVFASGIRQNLEDHDG